MRYTEDVSKNHQGGLNGRRVKPKVVLHHANTESPDHCFVRLFQLYRQRSPPDAPPSAFDSQREALSDILNRQGTSNTGMEQSEVTAHTLMQSAQHSHLLQGLSLPSATFSHCTLTFNIGGASSVDANQKPPKKRRAVILDDSDSD